MATRRRLDLLSRHFLASAPSAAANALEPAGGAVHPELARRGVTEYSCFDIPEGATVDELMAQRGAQDIDPAIAATLEPIFDMNADCIRNFDHDKFQRDGYWIWDKIWLPEANKKLIAACHNAQRLVDMYTQGYRELGDGVYSGVPDPDAKYEPMGWEKVDWEGLGLQKPERYRTPEEIQRILGGGQLGSGPPPGTGYRGHQGEKRVPVMKGYQPESFVAGYEPYIMFCLTHPQMMAVHKLMLGPEVRHDHNTLLFRKEGFPGQNWHSHAHHEGRARGEGPGASGDVVNMPDLQPDLGLVRTLIYPEGFKARGDGGLKIVPGGHLEREATLSFGQSQESVGNDDAFRKNWLAGRRHRVTGEPLDILCVDLPPGSMMSAAAHMPHGVEPRLKGRGTRLCTLFAYAKPDPDGEMVRSPERRAGGYAVSPEVLEAAKAGRIPNVPAGEKNLFTMY